MTGICSLVELDAVILSGMPAAGVGQLKSKTLICWDPYQEVLGAPGAAADQPHNCNKILALISRAYKDGFESDLLSCRRPLSPLQLTY